MRGLGRPLLRECFCSLDCNLLESSLDLCLDAMFSGIEIPDIKLAACVHRRKSHALDGENLIMAKVEDCSLMVYNIILGRNEADRQKFGTLGTIFLGKQYIQMGQVTALSNPIYLDVTRSHVVFVCGKRGRRKVIHYGGNCRRDL